MSRLQWEKTRIDPGAFESATAFDVNNDGVLDILCGGWWYEGPDFKTRHKVCDLIGDLALLGRRISGRVVASRSGHELNRQLVVALADKLDVAQPQANASSEYLDIDGVIGVLPHRYPFLLQRVFLRGTG